MKKKKNMLKSWGTPGTKMVAPGKKKKKKIVASEPTVEDYIKGKA